jgi:hypothetical protein
MNTNTLAVAIVTSFALFCDANANNQILGKYPIQFALGDYGSPQDNNTNIICFAKMGEFLIPKSSTTQLPVDSIRIVSERSPEATNAAYSPIPEAEFQELSKTIKNLLVASKVLGAINTYQLDNSANSQGAINYYPNDVGAKSSAEYINRLVKERYIDQKLADGFLAEFVLGNIKYNEGDFEQYPQLVSKNTLTAKGNEHLIVSTVRGNPTTYTVEQFAKLPKVKREPQFLP